MSSSSQPLENIPTDRAHHNLSVLDVEKGLPIYDKGEMVDYKPFDRQTKAALKRLKLMLGNKREHVMPVFCDQGESASLVALDCPMWKIDGIETMHEIADMFGVSHSMTGRFSLSAERIIQRFVAKNETNLTR